MTTYTHPKLAGAPAWVDVAAPDVDAARKFYQAVFGWDYDIGGPEFGGYRLAGGRHFAVASADATAAIVTQHGGQQMGSLDNSPFGRIAALRDPGGANFKIVQPPAG